MREHGVEEDAWTARGAGWGGKFDQETGVAEPC
jgi:hypothetical protein